MYICYVAQNKDELSGKRQGLSQVLMYLDEKGVLLDHQMERYEISMNGLERTFVNQRSFSRSGKQAATTVALSWFKDGAKEHIEKIREIVQILD